MRPAFWTAPAVACLAATLAPAQDGARFVERAPTPRKPPVHTMERAGNPQAISRWAVPGVSRYEAGAYVGGGSLRGNRVLTKGPYSVTGPTDTGTYGWDFAGFGVRPGRVFLAASPDPSLGSDYTRNYRTDGPRVLDVFALRPFRKAVLEKREVVEERKGEGEH